MAWRGEGSECEFARGEKDEGRGLARPSARVREPRSCDCPAAGWSRSRSRVSPRLLLLTVYLAHARRPCSSPPSSNSRHNKHQTARLRSSHLQRPTFRERSPYPSRNRRRNGSASLLRRAFRSAGRRRRCGTRSGKNGSTLGVGMARTGRSRISGYTKCRPMPVRIIMLWRQGKTD